MDAEKKYIDAEEAEKAIRAALSGDGSLANAQHFVTAVRTVKAADVQQIKRGRWIYERYGGMWPVGKPRPTQKCDQCGEWHYKDSKYCPECGAIMS